MFFLSFCALMAGMGCLFMVYSHGDSRRLFLWLVAALVCWGVAFWTIPARAQNCGSVPDPAALAGYGSATVADPIRLGKNWELIPGTKVQANPDGSATIAGSAVSKQTFKGGAYAHATLRDGPGRLAIAGSDDAIDMGVKTDGTFAMVLHEGATSTDIPPVSAAGIDFSQKHGFGILILPPAENSDRTEGLVSFYFDGSLVGQQTFKASGTFSRLTTQPSVFRLSSGSNPLTIHSASVWQAGGRIECNAAAPAMPMLPPQQPVSIADLPADPTPSQLAEIVRTANVEWAAINQSPSSVPILMPPAIDVVPLTTKLNNQPVNLTPLKGAVLRTADVLDTIGVNTHFDQFPQCGYGDILTSIAAINYTGIKLLRDSAQPGRAWAQVANATGARFTALINEEAPWQMQGDLDLIIPLARLGIIGLIDGANEEDDPYPASLGNTITIAAAFQTSVYTTAHALGLLAINMSFGAGWTPDNGWKGNYPNVGNLASRADFANAHTYPQNGETTLQAIVRLNGLAQLAAVGRPVITTEIGWDTPRVSREDTAKYVLQAVFDGIIAGNPQTYFYALYDDESGLWGLMRADGSPWPAGEALHNLSIILADPSPSFTTQPLNYSLSGATTNDHAVLMEKHDGSYWLALWNENDSPHQVTIGGVNSAQVFDPLIGTQPVGSGTTVTISDRLTLVKAQ